MLRDTIDRDGGMNSPASPETRKLDVVTRADEFPELNKPQLLDLHAAHVQMESLPFDRRVSAKRHLQRIGSAAGTRLRPKIFADLIREAIQLSDSGGHLD